MTLVSMSLKKHNVLHSYLQSLQMFGHLHANFQKINLPSRLVCFLWPLKDINVRNIFFVLFKCLFVSV